MVSLVILCSALSRTRALTQESWQLKRSSSEGVEIDLVGGKGLDLIPAALTSGAGGEYCRAMHVSRCMSIANDIISNR